MEKEKMIGILAEAAGLSNLELLGFYDSVMEQGFADQSDIDTVIHWGLPIDHAAMTINLKTPLVHEPFNIFEKLFVTMAEARDQAKKNTNDRFFHASCVIVSQAGVRFSDHPFVTHGGEYPNRKTMVDKFALIAQVHPSMVCILNIREMSEKDCKDFIA